ncbi:MAG: class I tRNA ligase family protein [Polyangiaceae bacterium]|jgi:methionyl-tRNA synthetase|nr:class I tRNA ligase family protein [Polyangiaceae bacterium]
MSTPHGPPTDVATVLATIKRPRRAVVTAGMPYANGPLHLGHLAGAHLPADIHARWMGLLIGRSNVLFVCGSDEHGSTSELAAMKASKPIRQFLDEIHDHQQTTLDRYQIGLDVYSGTSRPECFPTHAALSQDFLRKLHGHGLLEKRVSQQWYDPKAERFLPDRFVVGRCPKCGYDRAYSDECDSCGSQHEPSELIEPRSTVSDATPEMRSTVHWYLDMWAVSETLRVHLQSKEKTWRNSVLAGVLDKVLPALRFPRSHEEAYRGFKAELPKHKSKYTPTKELVLQFGSKPDLEAGRALLSSRGIDSVVCDEWAHRSITRDIAWGIPVPDLDPDLAGKTLYVWPDSLIAPIAFSQVALAARGQDPARYAEFWRDPDARIYQFLGQDNVFFYVLMQGALWLGTQADPHRLPAVGELNLTEIFGCFHLLVNGQKMSKSTGNFYTGDQLLEEKGYEVDQIRHYLALLGLSEKQSDFDFAKLDERNKFLAGPMNAAFERPISAAHSKFGGRVPEGVLIDKVKADTIRIVQRYVKAMERADYPNLLFEIENYARTINSLFTQHKPHDDRHPEEGRRNALFTSFYVLKNLMIMLYPFVPGTMERLRASLRLPPEVFSIDELGKPIPAGHELGPKGVYFPAVAGEPTAAD